MKRDSVFWAICGMDDDLILEAEEGISVGKKQGKRAVRIAMAVAGIAAVLAGTALAVRLYTKSADRMEENWNQQAQQPHDIGAKRFYRGKIIRCWKDGDRSGNHRYGGVCNLYR